MKRALLAVMLGLFTRSALACSCMGQPTAAQALQHADAVFAGVVDTIGTDGAVRDFMMDPKECKE